MCPLELEDMLHLEDKLDVVRPAEAHGTEPSQDQFPG